MKRTRRPRLLVSMPSGFVGFRFPPEVILLAVRWYLRYGLSYRDLEELLAERGIEVDHVTLYRWVQRFTPLVIDAARPCRHLAGDRGSSTRPTSRSVGSGPTSIGHRTFTAEYRTRVVAEYEAAPHGEKSAVLRREGLYQSQVRRWAAARDALARGTSAPRRPHRAAGRKDDPARLRAENQRLARELAKSQAVVEIMGKLQGLLESVSEGTDTSTSSTKR